MSATNATTNYELPVFIATDKPAWLVDWNGAMNTIDSAIKEAKTAGDNAQSTANTNANNIQTLDGTVTSQGTAIGNLQTAVSGNTGSINTINSLIGNGEPTTTDKTIIGAINEINAHVGAVSADDVSFDPTGTTLVATNVEDAIKEVAGGAVTPEADDVAYDNTTSGLSATNVQDAIDELASAGPSGADHGVYELWTNSNPSQAFAAQTVSIADITDYDALWLAFEHDTAEHNGATLVEVDTDRFATVAATVNFLDTVGWSAALGSIYLAMREATFTKVGDGCTIDFAKGQRATINALGSAFNFADYNEVYIPVRIIGVKHNA